MDYHGPPTYHKPPIPECVFSGATDYPHNTSASVQRKYTTNKL